MIADSSASKVGDEEGKRKKKKAIKCHSLFLIISLYHFKLTKCMTLQFLLQVCNVNIHIWYFWKTCLLLSAFFLSRMFLGGRRTYLVQSDGKADDIPRTKNKRYTWFLMPQEEEKKNICRRNNQSQNYPHISISGRSSKSSSASLRIFLWEPSLESHWECHKCQEWRNLM